MLLSAAHSTHIAAEHVVSPDVIEHRDAQTANIGATFSYSSNPISTTSNLQIISVTYTDLSSTALLVESSLPTSLQITGPGYSKSAAAEGPPESRGVNSYTVNYDAASPGGFAAGTYTVTVAAGSVIDSFDDSNGVITSTFSVSDTASGSPPTASVSAPNVTSETQAQSVTVTYSDATSAISGSGVGPSNITVTGPDGTLSVASSSFQQSGNNIVATYNLSAPNPSGWQPSDNGTYTATVNANSVTDGNGMGNATATGTFSIQIMPMLPPTATISFSPPLITTAQQNEVITVSYSSIGGVIDSSTIGAQNLSVVGPRGNTMSVMLLDSHPSGSTVDASYVVVNPDAAGFFLPADNGTYNVTVNAGAVINDRGEINPETSGSFVVSVRSPTTPIAAISSTPSLISSPNDAEVVTVIYAASSAINTSKIAASNVSVIAPNGLPLQILPPSITGSGNQIVVTYDVVAPSIGGEWHTADNGSYTVQVATGVVTDAGNNVNNPSAGAGFTVNIPNFSSRTPTISAATVTTSNQAALVTVTFGTPTGSLNPSVINPSNITVTSPGGKKLTVTVQNDHIIGAAVVGVYRVNPPSGIWLQADNGNYTIAAAPNAVKDSLGAGNTAGFGTFTVSVPAITTPLDVISAPNVTAFGQAFETFSVIYASSAKIVAPPLSSTEVGVYSANDTLLNTKIVGESGGGGNALTITYSTAAPNGIWRTADDGTYYIKVARGAVADANGHQNPANTATFSVNVPVGGPPTAAIAAPPVTAQGATTQTITVIYSGTLAAIDPATIANSNISVSGPAGLLNATSVQTSTDGNTTTAVYTVTAPGGSWQAQDDGDYAVTVIANSVKDLDGNAIAATSGTFNVNVSVIVTISVASSNTVPNIGDPVTYSATLSLPPGGPAPGGTITFRSGGTVLGVAAIETTVPVGLIVPATSPGNFPVSVTYSGDSNYPSASSTSSVVESVSPASVLRTSLVGALPPFVLPGQKTRIGQTIELTNKSAAAFSDIVNLAFYLAKGTTIDSNAISLPISFEKRVKIGASKQLGVRELIKQLPVGIPVGNYHLIVQLTDSTGATGITASQNTLNVVPATIDLSGTLAKIPATAKIGKTSAAILEISNHGSVSATGSLELIVYASTTRTFDQSTPIALHTARPIKIKPGKSEAIHLARLVLPSTAGSYYLIARLDPNNVLGDVNPANNTVVGTSPIMVG